MKLIVKGKTSVLGQVNFTLPDIGAGKVYVLKAIKPFKNGKAYHSGLIASAGKFQFVITRDGANELDLTPPKVAFSSPENAGKVPDIGFTITGSATDNRAIDKVQISIVDPVKGRQTIAGAYDAASRTWSARVPAALISLDNTIVLTATAFDQAQNQSTATVSVSVVGDLQGPDIVITSHTDNQQVPVTGFLLSGSVTDLTGVATLKASLTDSGLGETINARDVDFAIDNGIWTLVVGNKLMTEGGTADITLTASDTVGNTSSKTIHLLAVAVDYSNAQLINRITFGATPALLQEVEAMGAQAFLEQQLDPGSIDDSEFTTTLLGNMPTNKEELQAWTLRHMVYSKRQLQEVMTWFWDNHFNTDINTTRSNAQGMKISDSVQYEWNENQAFRSNALGNFRDLLGISAKSPAMLIYLDSISNVVNDSNENYARELLELHTMGVDGGYTHHDIESGAEIFTGWHLQNGRFFFNAAQHTGGSYTVLSGTVSGGITIADGGVEQGEQYLDALASHASTANFICTKLLRVFVSDTPPATLTARCAQTFLKASADADQITQVLRTILDSAEFYQPEYYRSKIKTPVEFVVGALRNLDAVSTGADLAAPIKAMGMRLYENPVPTGWTEIGSDWINSSLLIERIKWINDFVRNPATSNNSSVDPLLFYPTHGFGTAEGIVGYLLQLTVGDDLTALSKQNAEQLLGTDFDLSNPDAEALLQQLHGTVMSYPQYQFQ